MSKRKQINCAICKSFLHTTDYCKGQNAERLQTKKEIDRILNVLRKAMVNSRYEEYNFPIGLFEELKRRLEQKETKKE